jgi:hypothetical protein
MISDTQGTARHGTGLIPVQPRQVREASLRIMTVASWKLYRNEFLLRRLRKQPISLGLGTHVGIQVLGFYSNIQPQSIRLPLFRITLDPSPGESDYSTTFTPHAELPVRDLDLFETKCVF